MEIDGEGSNGRVPRSRRSWISEESASLLEEAPRGGYEVEVSSLRGSTGSGLVASIAAAAVALAVSCMVSWMAS